MTARPRARTTHSSAHPPLGRLLQQWRQRRGLSQLELGLKADVSSRHISFVENGRSSPSREMVLRLASALVVPLRDQNALLEAAGFAPVFRETPLDRSELSQVRRAIDLILRKQEPHPAVVLDRHWNIVQANDGAQRFFGMMLGKRASSSPSNVLRLVFDPEYLRPRIVNWPLVAKSLLQRVHREAVGGVLDAETDAIVREVRAHHGVGALLDDIGERQADGPLIPVQFRKGNVAMSYFSAVTTLGTPRDIALQEIRIESFFPADAETERAAKRLKADRSA